jgi:hypothetical protein
VLIYLIFDLVCDQVVQSNDAPCYRAVEIKDRDKDAQTVSPRW